MTEDRAERRLTTILAADVVGYSRLMAADEAGTLTSLKALRRELIEPKTAAYHGRVVKLMGDGTLMEFGSVVDAITFAVDVQRAMALRNADVPEHQRITYRIGINIGDIIVEGDDLYGDGVNVAARLEQLAEPGGIFLSNDAFRQVRGKVDESFEDLGDQMIKNIAEPVRTWRWVDDRQDDVEAAKYKLDLRDERLWHGDQLVEISNKAFELLRILVSNPNRLLTKDEILDAVWGDVCVSEGLIKEYVHDLRVALGDDPKQPRFIETVHGRGYRFLGGIDKSNDPAVAEARREHGTHPPSLVVLPFANLSDDPKQEYFSDGITEDIITELSRFSELIVIARNSSFAYKDLPVDIKQVARELSVRYVMEGSVRRDGERLRITAQLIEADSGGHIWGEKYDRELGEIFDVQDEITRQVVGSIAPQVELAELERSRKLSETDLSAYELALKAQAVTYDAVRVADPNTLVHSMALANAALELDNRSTHALWTRGMGFIFQHLYGWGDDLGGALTSAIETADQLIGINPSNAKSYVVRAWAHQYRREYDLALADYRRALELNPNLALNLFTMAWSEAVAGLAAEAREHAQMALKLSPRDTDIWLGWAYAALELASFIEGDFAQAMKWGRLAIQMHAKMPNRQVVMVAGYGHLGDIEAAKSHVNALKAFAPDFLPAVLSGNIEVFRLPEHNVLLVEGVRRAGL
jgi:TolB-like protein/class 3 adenylate cyclase